jgi:DNA-binding PadR family transcriptional regulator
MGKSEELILVLLKRARHGRYGSDLCADSDGVLKRSSVYSLLARLEAAGFVSTQKDEAAGSGVIPRTACHITDSGQSALSAIPKSSECAAIAVLPLCGANR